jgi:LPXTG-motif cell wall-anchored protein
MKSKSWLAMLWVILASILPLAAENSSNPTETATRKTNYWLPIVGGAVMGIALALWLKRKKNG